jgi:hypothetical protein
MGHPLGLEERFGRVGGTSFVGVLRYAQDDGKDKAVELRSIPHPATMKLCRGWGTKYGW